MERLVLPLAGIVCLRGLGRRMAHGDRYTLDCDPGFSEHLTEGAAASP